MFVGTDRIAAVDDLMVAFDSTVADRVPRMVVLEAETGLGKTRIIREFYARLASERQTEPRYWPMSLDRELSGDPLRDRKRIVPATPFTVPGGAKLPYMWWGVVCDQTQEGSPTPKLLESSRQFEVHAAGLAEERGPNAEAAAQMLTEVLDIVSLADPVQISLKAAKAVSAGVGIFHRMRRKSREGRLLQADRRIELTSDAEDDRARQLAGAVNRAVSRGLPLIFVVDDAHLADPLMISFLRQMMQITEGALLIVVAAWPSALHAPTDEPEAGVAALLDSASALLRDRLLNLRVRKLDDDAVSRLLLEAAPLTEPAVVHRFCEVIDGNPLLLRLFLNLDVVRRDIKDGKLDSDPAMLGRLPSDMKLIWQQLWRQLPESTRFALSIAATQGREFHPGFIERAAVELREFDLARTGLDDAHDTSGWVTSVDGGLLSFTERLRFEVAQENRVQQLDGEQMSAVARALVEHTCSKKAEDSWAMTAPTVRHALLKAHVSLVRSDVSIGSAAAAADSALQLSELVEEEGDEQGALEFAGLARSFIEAAEDADPELRQRIDRRMRQLLGQDGSGDTIEANDAEAADKASPSTPMQSTVPTWAPPSSTTLIPPPPPPLTPAPTPSAAADDQGTGAANVQNDPPAEKLPQAAPGTVPWTGWAVRDYPGVFQAPVKDMVDLVVEIVTAEGPVIRGRVHRLIALAASAPRLGRLMREQIDQAISTATRQKRVVDVTPYRGADSSDRELSLPGTPRVVVRTRGDRSFEEIPFSEFAEVARRVLMLNADTDTQMVERAVLNAFDAVRMTQRVERMMKRAIDIARREMRKAGDVPASHAAMSTSVANRLYFLVGWLDEHGPEAIAALLEGTRDVFPSLSPDAQVVVCRSAFRRKVKGTGDAALDGTVLSLREGDCAVIDPVAHLGMGVYQIESEPYVGVVLEQATFERLDFRAIPADEEEFNAFLASILREIEDAGYEVEWDAEDSDA